MMLKSVADELSAIKMVLDNTASNKIAKMQCWSAINNDVIAIRSVVEITPEISHAESMLLAAAQRYTGRSSISATVLRSPEEDRQVLDAAYEALSRYRNALRTAK